MFVNRTLLAAIAALAVAAATPAEAQVVYYSAMRPVVAAPMVMAPVVAALLQEETGLDPHLDEFLELCQRYTLVD